MPLPDGALPEDWLEADVLDRAFVIDMAVNGRPEESSIEVSIALEGELNVALPGFELLSLVVGGPALATLPESPTPTDDEPIADDDEAPLGDETPVDSEESPPRFTDGYTFLFASLFFSRTNTVFTLHDVNLALRFDPAFLKPVTLTGEPAPAYSEIQTRGTISLDRSMSVSITGFDSVSLPLSAVGETGLMISADNVKVDFSTSLPELELTEARVYLPDPLPVPPGLSLFMQNAKFSPTGFSGEIGLDLNLEYDEDAHAYSYQSVVAGGESSPATILGLQGGLRHIGVNIVHNQLTACEVNGSLLVKYFEQPVDIRVNISSIGDFTVSLQTEIEITREELLALNLKSLSVGKDENDVAKVVVSGGLEPLLMSSEGMQWPKLDVTDLSIDSNGKFSIKEAWLDLKELATLDLWGFYFELRRIGIGSTDDGARFWIDLSGGLRLIEQIPVALDVEGFRLTWPKDLFDDLTPPFAIEDIRDKLSEIQVEFAGIDLSFSVPNAIEFSGLIRFFKQPQLVGFAGDVALRLPASGFAAEAGLMIGLSFDPLYPFLYVYFGVELPAGIPLGQSGLALKGALGMFGLNVAPDKTPDQNWYYDWYKRGPIVGAHPTNKWKPQKDALAVGVGVTITTADGVIKGTRGLLVLSLPGPFLMIEGRALILTGLQPNAEPPLCALAIFDGGAGTVQFNVEAEATIVENVLQAYGMLEAFFDFNDLTNWHLYLGQDTPRDRRIRGEILKLGDSFLFDTNAYLMIDMVDAGTVRSRMGASISFEPKISKIDLVEIEFVATLEGDGVLTANPTQFSGELDLSAHLKLTAFDLSMKLSADAEFLTEGVKPLKVGAHLTVAAELPAPLDPLEATFEFEWKSEESPTIKSPLSDIDVRSRFARRSKTALDSGEPAFKILRLADIESTGRNQAERSPLVPVDGAPLIGFRHKMNSLIASFARHPDGHQHHYDVGIFQFYPSLLRIKLYEHPKEKTWTGEEPSDWKLIGESDNDEKPLPGIWLAEADLDSHQEASPKRLQLWTDNPLSSSAYALGSGYSQFAGCITSRETHHAGKVLEDNPDLMKCLYTVAESVCIDFDLAENMIIEAGEGWEYNGLFFKATRTNIALQNEPEVNPPSNQHIITRLIAWLLRMLIGGLNWFSKRWRFAARLLKPIVDMILRWLTALLQDAPVVEHSCMFVNGYLEIHFRPRVKKVQIVLCQKPKFPDPEMAEKLSTHRGIRTLDELMATGITDRPVTLNDVHSCSVPVEVSFESPEHQWRLETDEPEGFDCLRIIHMDKFAIRRICYTTIAEVKRSERAAEECANNGRPPGLPHMFRPGAYYKLEIETTVTGEENWDNLPFDAGAPIGAMLQVAYENFLDNLTGDFNQTITEFCFFQTEHPPTNLRPYVKWCYPETQSERFFYRDNVTIRFLRSGVRNMFGFPFDLKIQLRDAKGKLLEGYETSWSKARSATLFSEETIWNRYRDEELDWSPAPVVTDDLLLARRERATRGLLPRSRYKMEVVRKPLDDDKTNYWYFVVDDGSNQRSVTNVFAVKGPDIAVYYQMRVFLNGFQGTLEGYRFEDPETANSSRNGNLPGAPTLTVPDPMCAPLYVSDFVTSAFPSFAALVGSYSGRAKLLNAKPQRKSRGQLIDDLQSSSKRMARARWDWHLNQVDHCYEELEGGKQGLEAARLELREACALHDENFRAVADSLSDLYFLPLAERLEVYVVTHAATQEIVCCWLRSPESLDMRLAVYARASSAQLVGFVGRTEITSVKKLWPTTALEFDAFSNADGTQVIIFPSFGANEQVVTNLSIGLEYHRHYDDEMSANDHRYDRPVEYVNATAPIEPYRLRVSLRAVGAPTGVISGLTLPSVFRVND